MNGSNDNIDDGHAAHVVTVIMMTRSRIRTHILYIDSAVEEL